MPICTYLSESEQDRFSVVFDPDLNELFQEVIQKKGKKIFIQELEHLSRNWWGRKSITRTYSVYFDFGHLPEVQIMNFPPPDFTPRNSLNTSTSKQCVMSYLYGVISNL